MLSERSPVEIADHQWSESLIERFGALQSDVRREYQKHYARSREAGRNWLKAAFGLLERAPKLTREIHSPEDVREAARTLAEACEILASHDDLDQLCTRYRLPKVPGTALAARLARACDIRYWRRVLRREYVRFHDQLMRHLGFVRSGKQIYCSEKAVRFQRNQKAANLDVLSNLLAISDAGDELSLIDIHQASLANPAVRRPELLARIRGLERYAVEARHAALFITLTTPSPYHACPKSTAMPGGKYNGASPRDANAQMNRVWQRIRAKLKRDSIPIYGIRIAEPHHDGTPHWHLLLFHRPRDLRHLKQTFRRYALEEHGDEPGAQLQRVNFKVIDQSKGSATGYVIKYVAKSVDGTGVGADLHGNTAERAAERVVSWARTWGIRQFQFVGGPAVGLWREYRRIQPEYAARVPPSHREAWQAASVDGRFDQFCHLMGGIAVGRRTRTLIERAALLDPETGELRRYKDRYGDCLPRCARPITGLNRDGEVLRTRTKFWCVMTKAARQGQGLGQGPKPAWRVRTVEADSLRLHVEVCRWIKELDEIEAQRGRIAARSATAIFPSSRAGEAVAPWTRVNNCTGSMPAERDSVSQKEHQTLAYLYEPLICSFRNRPTEGEPSKA